MSFRGTTRSETLTPPPSPCAVTRPRANLPEAKSSSSPPRTVLGVNVSPGLTLVTVGATTSSQTLPSRTTVTCTIGLPVKSAKGGGGSSAGTAAGSRSAGVGGIGTTTTGVVCARAAFGAMQINAAKSRARRRIGVYRLLLELESPAKIHAEVAERRR